MNAFVDGAQLVLLHRDASGQLLARRRKAEWVSFFRTADLSVDLLRDLRASRNVVGMKVDGEWTRVSWIHHEARAAVFGLRRGGDDYFGDKGIQHFEADVDPVRRYFADSCAKTARPRRCYLDIETDPRVTPTRAREGQARVLCWAISDDQNALVASSVLESWGDDAERALLERMWGALERYDQICAWYGDGFDFPVVRKRTDRTGAKTKDLRRWLFCDHLEVYQRNNLNSAESGDEKESLKLEDVAQARLGEGKAKPPPEVVARFGDKSLALLGFDLWEAGGEFRELLLRYCERDVALLPRIERETGYLSLHDTVCEICSCFPDTRSTHPTRFVDGYMLRLGAQRGHHFRTIRYRGDEERKKFAGAWVMEPTAKGIVKGVHVADFSGMYPSIIESFNMSPETRRDGPINGPVPEGCCRTPSTGVLFATEPKGLLAQMVEEIGETRAVWSKRQAELPPGTPEARYAAQLSMGYKVVRNSCYGAAGSQDSRIFDVQLAEGVTQTGVWLIQKTIHEAQRRGFVVIYGDTDACYLTNVTREQFAEFVDWCNAELYPPALVACGCKVNHVEIAYEKEYERLVFVGSKKYTGVRRHFKWTTSCTCTTAKGRPGALDVRTMTCRDCGLRHETLPPPKGKPDIKGLEYKRGDAALLARKLQWRCIQKLMTEFSENASDFVSMVEETRDHVLNDPLPIEEIRLSKAISKPLREYVTKVKKDGTQTADLPHVQVGKMLQARGEQVEEGTRIAYYVKDASVSPMVVAPAVDYDGSPDRHYAWESMTFPATMRLLLAAFPGSDWRRYERTRPKKERGGKAQMALEHRVPLASRKPDPGQGGLFDLPPPAASTGK